MTPTRQIPYVRRQQKQIAIIASSVVSILLESNVLILNAIPFLTSLYFIQVLDL
jgi:hypothetical protein